ncbi:MAG: GNAT family N-acetyltransferase [Anaerolineae bacterium]
MILRAERVTLRPMREKDAKLIVEWRNDPAIRKWLFSDRTLTVESHLEWFRRPKPDRLDYVICLREARRPIGTVSFTRIEPQEATAEVGILLGDRTQWGEGLATETYRRWLPFGFRRLDLQYIYGRTLSTNHRNIRKNLRLGFCVEKILRDEYRRGDEVHDVVVMGLRREDARELGLLEG